MSELFTFEGFKKEEDIEHYGINGQKWGLRRYQNPDGTLTPAGRARYRKEIADAKQKMVKLGKDATQKAKQAKERIQDYRKNNDIITPDMRRKMTKFEKDTKQKMTKLGKDVTQKAKQTKERVQDYRKNNDIITPDMRQKMTKFEKDTKQKMTKLGKDATQKMTKLGKDATQKAKQAKEHVKTFIDTYGQKDVKEIIYDKEGNIRGSAFVQKAKNFTTDIASRYYADVIKYTGRDK